MGPESTILEFNAVAQPFREWRRKIRRASCRSINCSRSLALPDGAEGEREIPRTPDSRTVGVSRLILFSPLNLAILIAHAASAFAGPPLRIASTKNPSDRKIGSFVRCRAAYDELVSSTEVLEWILEYGPNLDGKPG
jgi:hypothetical protein